MSLAIVSRLSQWAFAGSPESTRWVAELGGRPGRPTVPPRRRLVRADLRWAFQRRHSSGRCRPDRGMRGGGSITQLAGRPVLGQIGLNSYSSRDFPYAGRRAAAGILSRANRCTSWQSPRACWRSSCATRARPARRASSRSTWSLGSCRRSSMTWLRSTGTWSPAARPPRAPGWTSAGVPARFQLPGLRHEPSRRRPRRGPARLVAASRCA